MIQSFAPGRVEILGNHTDYNDGVVLSAALELGIRCEGREAPGGEIRLSSEGEPGEFVLPAGESLLPNATWVDYPLGVAKLLRDAGHAVRGFACGFFSNLPTGAGLSSSAALEVATAVFLCRLFGISLSGMEVAKICKDAENQFVGVNCGLLDQVSSVFGKKEHLVFLDCRAGEVNRIPMVSGVELLIINSGVRHALTGGEYNERREQCFEAAQTLGVSHLRDVTSARVLASEALPEVVKRRALHITGENERVLLGVKALENRDVEAFGQLMFASHESSRVNFENSTRELDVLVSLAAETQGVLGSRLTGGGFGGATVSLVRSGFAEPAAKSITASYHKQTGHKPTAHICQIGDGALPEGRTC